MTQSRIDRAIIAEMAGKDYYRAHPCSDRATAEQMARNYYPTVLERECFIAGWQSVFASAQCH